VLLLGASGYLGGAIARGLLAAGFEVHGLARVPSPSVRAIGGATWHFGDLRNMTSSQSWAPLLTDVGVIVNAAGALQDGLRDDLGAVHGAAVEALCSAAKPGTLFVQISAPGVSSAASTAFYRSKSQGDAAVAASGLPCVILRPTVVVSADAYGGTALLRALAAIPGAIPVVNPQSLFRTVGLNDVVAAVLDAAEGRLATGSDVVLGEEEARSLAEVLLLFRSWLGLPSVPVVQVPRPIARAISTMADIAGLLGWRSPLRSTALQVAADGVSGSPLMPCSPLEEQLNAFPATVQERWFARLYLLKAATLLLLSLFWVVSGVIGLSQLSESAAILTHAGIGPTAAALAVVTGSLADIVLGCLVLVRRWSAKALIGMVALTGFYIAAASVVTPGMWLDPMGSLVKSIPAAMLAVLALAIDPER